MKRALRQRRAASRRPIIERLETRVVLDAAIGTTGDLGELGLLVPSGSEDEPAGWESTEISRFSSAEELEDFLLRDALKRYGGLFGKPTWNYDWWYNIATGVPVALDLAADSGARSNDYSQTNVQVEGVDEGDVIKTDGRYLYVARDDELTVIDVQTPESPEVVTRQTVGGSIQAMYLTEDRLTVISEDPWDIPYFRMAAVADVGDEGWQSEPSFQVTVFDVAQPEDAAVISRFEIDGSYSDSRMLDQTVYLVSQADFHLPTPAYRCSDEVDGWKPDSPDAVDGMEVFQDADLMLVRPFGGPWRSCVYETEAEYVARFEGQVLSTVLPGYTIDDATDEIAGDGLLVAAESIFRPHGRDQDRLLTIAAIDVSGQPRISDSAAVPAGWAEQVYMSHDNLYVALPTVLESEAFRSGVGLLKFSLEGPSGGIELAARGEVGGWLPNVFAMDEHGGYFRIVTQEGWAQDGSTHLHVLEEVGDRLVTVGDLPGLAPGERLHSVRFLGDQAFVVTFGPIGGNWIDPLWTIDLSDPTSPRVIGELEIPGFSDYLHWAGPNHLVGLGRDADIQTGRSLAPQLSLFDVSDFADPQLSGRVIFGDAVWSWSDAFSDHHAVSFFPETGVFAIPMTTVENRPVVRDRQWDFLHEERHELWVFQVDVNAGIDESLRVLGRIAHDTPVRRSVRIGATLYSISHDEVQVHTLMDPAQRLAQLSLTTPVTPDPGWQELAQAAIDDLSQRLNVRPASIDIVSVANVDWPDSCLGIPTDLMCLQVIVPGYEIRLSHDGMIYSYHTDLGSRVEYAGPEVDIAPLVRIRLEPVDAEGNLLTRVEAGESFLVNVHAEDLRRDAQGVFAAYVNVTFQDRLLRVDGDIQFGSEFANGQSAKVDAPGMVKALGAVADLTPGGDDQRIVAKIPVVARRGGKADLSLALADEGEAAVRLYGFSQTIPPDRILLETAELIVRPSWHNFEQPTDVNQDEATTAQDALIAINDINLEGIRQLEPIPDDLAQLSDAVHFCLDVNRDGHLTPWDALLVVNRLNQLARLNGSDARPEGEDSPSNPDWPEVLDAFQTPADRGAELAQRLLTVGSEILQDLDPVPWWQTDPQAAAIRQIWEDLRENREDEHSIDEAIAALEQWLPQLDEWDLEQTLSAL